MIKLVDLEFINNGSKRPLIITKETFKDHWSIHNHDFFEITICIEGKGYHISESGKASIHPGKIFIIPEGSWHGFETEHLTKLIHINFDKSIINDELSSLLLDSRINQILKNEQKSPRSTIEFELPITSSNKIIDIADEMFNLGHDIKQTKTCFISRCEKNEDYLLNYEMRLSLLRVILIEIARSISLTSDTLPTAISEVIYEIKNDISRDWTVYSLAQLAHLEPSYFGRLFKKEVGETPMEYVMILRVQRAAQMLKSGNIYPKEVSTACGFKTYSHFFRRFKEFYSVTPSSFIKACQQKYR